MTLRRKAAAKPAAAKALPSRGRSPRRLWPSDAEQTLEALRAGLIDALVIPRGATESVYALRTFEELEQANRDLSNSQERLLMLLNERERLMQDLHDGCMQSIYAVGLTLEDSRGMIHENPALAAEKIAQAQAGLNLVIQELRAFISGNKGVGAVDLASEIARIVNSLGENAPAFKLDISNKAATALDAECAQQLLQIAREAVSNILKHANASHGRISLRRRGQTLRLEVRDDGSGFDTTAIKRTGLGLHHIAARAQKLGGRMLLSSKPARGSSLLIEVPAP